MTMVKEHPILFSGPMVRAILAGKKTQTRRVVKLTPQPNNLGHWEPIELGGPGTFLDKALTIPNPDPAEVCLWHTRTGSALACPYGRPGDRLWVRETWALEDSDARHRNSDLVSPIPSSRLGPSAPYKGVQNFRSITWRAIYRAEGERPEHKTYGNIPWTPSIHMPRWASRLTLELTDVRVQQLQEITEEDVRREGLAKITKDNGRTWKFGMADRDGLPGEDDDGEHWQKWDVNPQAAFSRRWDQIYSKRAPWDSNPWVWALTFEAVGQ